MYKTKYLKNKKEYISLLGGDPNNEIITFKHSILQIYSNNKNYDIYQPFIIPTNEVFRGSGFIIYFNNKEKKSIIVTNAHVVKNSRNFWCQIPLFGDTIFKLNLISCSLDFDIAVMEFDTDVYTTFNSYENIESIESKIKPFKIFDSLDLQETEQVIAIGYPLGNPNIQFTSGVLGGFSNENNTNYLQITAPINPGNSGGPLVIYNEKNVFLVGINSAGLFLASNVGYAIPSRTMLNVIFSSSYINAHYKLKKDGKYFILESSSSLNNSLSYNNFIEEKSNISCIKFGIEFSIITDDYIEKHTSPTISTSLTISTSPTISMDIKKEYGIFITKVQNWSSFYNCLKENDILFSIKFTDNLKNEEITAFINHFGKIKLNNTDRELTLAQMLDVFRIDQEVTVKVYRENKICILNTTLVPSRNIFNEKNIAYDKIQYIIFAGICITEYCNNYEEDIDNNNIYYLTKKKKCK